MYFRKRKISKYRRRLNTAAAQGSARRARSKSRIQSPKCHRRTKTPLDTKNTRIERETGNCSIIESERAAITRSQRKTLEESTMREAARAHALAAPSLAALRAARGRVKTRQHAQLLQRACLAELGGCRVMDVARGADSNTDRWTGQTQVFE